MILGPMEDAKYRAMEGLAQSDLAWMKKSPQHFLRRKELQRETLAMRFGTVFHTALLEPKRFLASYMVEPTEIEGVPVNRRLKAHRDYLNSLPLIHPEKIIISPKHHDNLIGMANSFSAEMKNNKLLADLLRAGKPETVAAWDYRGRKCKGKADLFIENSPHGRVIIDLKKTQDASQVGFARSVHNFSYNLQGSWYARGFEADKVIMIAVEEQFPHAIGVYDMDLWSASGNALVERLLDRLDECERTQEWPWYTNKLELLLPPTWMPAVANEEVA